MKHNTKYRAILTSTSLGAVLLSAACTSPYDAQQYRTASRQPYQSYDYSPSSGPTYNGWGKIDAIDIAQADNQSRGITGALVGGLLGGVVGHQIGHGSGNTVATAGGAVGGALVGNQVEQRDAQGQTSYAVRIGMNDNGYQTINLKSTKDLHVGDRVRIDSGQISRY